ncbi:MAG: hypothetical protein J5I90_03225 [Caldilineales bacterium]|nr:hypothetical protein [Caldilineales bacterium]
MASASEQNNGSASLSLIDLQFRQRWSLWRITAFWAFIAGVIMTLVSDPSVADWSIRGLGRLALGLILADAIWGAMWAQAAMLRQDVESARNVRLPGWPYATEHAPGTRILGWLTAENGSGSRDMWLVAVVGLGLALFLGKPAIVLTILVVIFSILGALLLPAYPAAARFLKAIVGVVLPWWLGYLMLTTASEISVQSSTLNGVLLLPGLFALLRFALDQAAAGASKAWLWAAGGLLAVGLFGVGLYFAAAISLVIILFIFLPRPRLNPKQTELLCLLSLGVTLLNLALA